MNEEQIRDEARKAANRSQFMSNHIYDHKSYEDGFYEGMNQALRQPPVIKSFACLDDKQECDKQCGACKFVEEALRQPPVISSVCTCANFRETPMINGKHICSICNKPIVQTDL